MTPDATAPAPPRGGRDLRSAVLVGVGLLGTALVGLVWLPWLLVLLAVSLLVGAVNEVAVAIRQIGLDVPRPPLWVGAAVMPLAAWTGGIPALFLALMASLVLMFAWTAVTRRRPMGQFMLAGTFVLLWAPFLLSFAAALLDQPAGHMMVVCLLLMVVSNDTFGYMVGYRWGRTPIAPRISPKKSWEGALGSLAGSVAVGSVLVPVLVGHPWWAGALLGALTVGAATAGDFSESMVKRELGIKDMSSALPGHGGIMDRLDSLVFAAPVAYAVLALPLS